jgi:long-chain acyl-CoA synthetase
MTHRRDSFDTFLKREKTLACMMLERSRRWAPRTALRFVDAGQWRELTWGAFGEDVRAVGLALLELGLQPGDMAAIFSANRPEWAIADLGALAVRGVTVPIYATNSAQEAGYILGDARTRIVFVGNQAQYDNVRQVAPDCPALARIVAFDPDVALAAGVDLHFHELLDLGRRTLRADELDQRLQEAGSDDLLTLIYTSGTTGPPKGAMHTHRSFMAGIHPSVSLFPEAGPDDISLAILPLSHVFERMWSYGCMSSGMQIAYCPSPDRFLEAMQHIRPHYLTSVPRIWEKVHAAVHDGIAGAPPLKRKLFYWALAVGREAYHTSSRGQAPGWRLRTRRALADKLVLAKVRTKLGSERNKVFHVGGAPLAPEINAFFQALGINIIQGYGLTEFFPVCVGYGTHGRCGACGPVLPSVEVRIADDGEIQLRGAMAMQGYYGKPLETVAAFTPDGWYKTGDVGRLDNGGLRSITITDRIKDLIVTAGGKKIAPQPIEVMLAGEPLIAQVVLVGDNRKHIAALVVPNFARLEPWAREQGLGGASPEELIRNPSVVRLFEEKVAARSRTLGQAAQIKKIILLPREMSQESGEMTPTLKVKRQVVQDLHRQALDRLYAE